MPKVPEGLWRSDREKEEQRAQKDNTKPFFYFDTRYEIRFLREGWFVWSGLVLVFFYKHVH